MSCGRGVLFASPLSMRPAKRHHPSVLNGITTSFEDKTNDFLCPICFELIEEAHITRCGHTFCYRCITRSLDVNCRCPKCSYPLAGTDVTVPNFLLNEVIAKYKTQIKLMTDMGMSAENSVDESQNSTDSLREFIASESNNLSLGDINVMLDVLKKRKLRLESESIDTQNRLVQDFLNALLEIKERQMKDITNEISVIKRDLEEVMNLLNKSDLSKDYLPEDEDMMTSDDSQVKKEAVVPDRVDLLSSRESFNSIHKNTETTKSSYALRNKIIQNHFEDFVACYFTCRAKEIAFGKTEGSSSSLSQSEIGVPEKKADTAATTTTMTTANRTGLDVFRDNLNKFSRYSKLRPVATLNYSNDIYNNSTIVSSIEFDKDNEFFAIAGVTKRIKVYEYSAVIRDTVDIHYPCIEIVSSSKISCISWNSYVKSILASSDYEGTVTIWDTTVGQRMKSFNEHEKRCWSVDFNDVDTRLIASGSDDARVKLWSLNMEHSVASLEAKANVCCVKFNPRSACHLAFGSADHCVHYYDLRNMKQALAIFKGHRKAVSYVKFLNHEEIVSASTDSQLKLWNVNASYCLRSFVGHINEKNFVGLATDGDYVACGSENNSLYVYYKGLSKQLLSCKFDTVRSLLEKEQKEDDVNEFVSAVCWRQTSNIVVAANSQGIIKVMELV